MRARRSVLFALVSVAAIPVFSACATLPRVGLDSSSVYDWTCSEYTHYKIAPEWTRELETRLPEFRKLWARDGEKLLASTVQVVGKPFKQKEFQAVLSVCSIPSMSEPLLINVRYSLASFTQQPIPDHVLVAIIYHEILHSYLDGMVPAGSPLMKKYSGEPQIVQDHLHLLAVMKAAYLRLGWGSRLEEVIEKDSELPNGAYKRAWQIVGKEGYQHFIAEIRK